MKFNLVICTYKRPQAIKSLIESVLCQTMVPDEILVVDASPDEFTSQVLDSNQYIGLKYFNVGEEDRGLTRQRNYGISKTSKDIEIICFLDDDIILEPGYFENLINTYYKNPQAIGVGGFIVNEVNWREENKTPAFEEFAMDGFIRHIGSRNLLRKKVRLLSDKPPGIMPEFSNGLSISFLPPSGKTYPVEFFMGGVASYRKNLLEKISFSEFFEGYGLYEDMDFCLRASNHGQLYVNTAARVVHNHEERGRPNKFEYGKMVIRNGWYVWRVKYPQPGLTAQLKWYATAILLSSIRLGNVLTSTKKREAFFESIGRFSGLINLLFKKPKIR